MIKGRRRRREGEIGVRDLVYLRGVDMPYFVERGHHTKSDDGRDIVMSMGVLHLEARWGGSVGGTRCNPCELSKGHHV